MKMAMPDPGAALTPIPIQPRRFYDGGLDAVGSDPEIAPDPSVDPQILLLRMTEDGLEQFAMQRRIAYDDRHLGELLVPRVTATFRTDLTSVPALFTWLVPKTGEHLPAALIHDGLVHPPDDVTYVSTAGHVVLRAEADRVLRDAMADTGTGVIRRWLVWSAVTAVTMISGAGTGWSPAQRWRYRLAAGASVVIVALLGICATVDLVGGSWLPTLPWMDSDVVWRQVVGGLAGAVVVPLLLALTWGRFRVAGAVVGLTLALLLHVTLALLVLTFVYRGAELAVRKAPVLVAVLSGAVVVAAVVAFVLALR